VSGPFADPAPRTTARLAGLFYLLFIVASILADRFGKLGFGDAAAVAAVMESAPAAFRLGFVCAAASAALFLAAAWALYLLLKPINSGLATLLLVLNLAGVAVQCASLLAAAGAGLWLGGADYLAALATDLRRAQALVGVDLYKRGMVLAQLFYGAWTFPLGLLIFRSGFLPRWLGVLLMVDCASVWIWFGIYFLFPAASPVLPACYALSALAEFSLTGYLLAIGVRTPRAAPTAAA
jgi:hypothetical protein